MATESTKGNVCSQELRDKVAQEWVAEMIESPERAIEKLEEIARDGFTGFRHEDDREVFRHAMMYGLLDEDAHAD